METHTFLKKKKLLLSMTITALSLGLCKYPNFKVYITVKNIKIELQYLIIHQKNNLHKTV